MLVFMIAYCAVLININEDNPQWFPLLILPYFHGLSHMRDKITLISIAVDLCHFLLHINPLPYFKYSSVLEINTDFNFF